jgi:hypothetical protein
MFVAAVRLFDTTTALTATLFLAVSQLAIQYSQEVRCYELLFLLLLATLYFFVIATSRRVLAAWCGCTLCAILMVATHYYGAFAAAAFAAYVGLHRRERLVPLTWIAGAALAGCAALLPWAAFAVKAQASVLVARPWNPVSWTNIFGTLNRFNNGAVDGLHSYVPRWTFGVGGLLFTCPVIMTASSWFKRAGDGSGAARNSTSLCLVLWLTPLVLALLAGLAIGNYDVRYATLCTAPYYILVARGISRLPSIALRRGWVLALLFYSCYALRANYYIPYKENFRDAAAYVAARSVGNQCYAFVPDGAPPLPWAIYTSGSPMKVITPRQRPPSFSDCRGIWVTTSQRVKPADWILLSGGLVPLEPLWREWLEALRASRSKSDEQQFYLVTVELYQ